MKERGFSKWLSSIFNAVGFWILMLLSCAETVNAASPDWVIVLKNTNSEEENIEIFVDNSSLRFDKQFVTASLKFESNPKIALVLTRFDCAKSTAELMGGSESEDGVKFKRIEPRKPEAAPAGTQIGYALAFVCDLRPAWRKLLD